MVGIGVATTAVGLAVLLRLLTVFPFEFTDQTANWDLVARFALIFALAGAAIGLLVQAVILVRRLIEAAPSHSDHRGGPD